ncbi:hypothetical protein G9A89_002513 [Geosiphon pyriformis]|nr:hypothetical protein G9A89_002513 [Geosiphon pyriformis]
MSQNEETIITINIPAENLEFITGQNEGKLRWVEQLTGTIIQLSNDKTQAKIRGTLAMEARKLFVYLYQPDTTKKQVKPHKSLNGSYRDFQSERHFSRPSNSKFWPNIGFTIIETTSQDLSKVKIGFFKYSGQDCNPHSYGKDLYYPQRINEEIENRDFEIEFEKEINNNLCSLHWSEKNDQDINNAHKILFGKSLNKFNSSSKNPQEKIWKASGLILSKDKTSDTGPFDQNNQGKPIDIALEEQLKISDYRNSPKDNSAIFNQSNLMEEAYLKGKIAYSNDKYHWSDKNIKQLHETPVSRATSWNQETQTRPFEYTMYVPNREFPYGTSIHLGDCIKKISTVALQCYPLDQKGKEVHLTIFFGLELFFNFQEIPRIPLTIQQWCDIKREGDALKTSFQHNAILIDEQRLLDLGLGFKKKWQSQEKWNTIVFFRENGVDKKMKLVWDSKERIWKIKKLFKEVHRVVVMDVLSGANGPDFRFSTKTQVRIPIENRLREIISEIQPAMKTRYEAQKDMEFRPIDFENRLRVNRSQQMISKKRFINRKYRINIVLMRQDSGNNVVNTINEVRLKHMDWVELLDQDDLIYLAMRDKTKQTRQMLDDTIQETIGYTREIVKKME